MALRRFCRLLGVTEEIFSTPSIKGQVKCPSRRDSQHPANEDVRKLMGTNKKVTTILIINNVTILVAHPIQCRTRDICGADVIEGQSQ